MESGFEKYNSKIFSRLHVDCRLDELEAYMKRVETTTEDVKDILKRMMRLPQNNICTAAVLGAAISNCRGGTDKMLTTAIQEAVLEYCMGK